MKNRMVQLIATLVFMSGVMNIASAFWAKVIWRLMFLEGVLPLQVSNVSRTLILLIGFSLIYLARGLWSKKRRAWVLSVVLLSVSLGSHLAKGLDIEESLVSLVPLTLLFLFRDQFIVQSGRLETAMGILRAVLVLGVLFGYAVLGFYALKGQFTRPVTWKNIKADYAYSIFGVGHDALVPRTRRAVWFENSISTVSFAAFIFALESIFVPLIRFGKPSEEERWWMRHLMLEDADNSSSYLALMDDKQYYFLENGHCGIAYKVRRNTAVALGDPIGNKSYRKACVDGFISEMRKYGLTPIFTNVTEEMREVHRECGLKTIKIGEEAVIETSEFTLDGSGRADVRHGIARMEREGMRHQWHNLGEVPWEVMVEVDKLHTDWMARKGSPAMTFSLDFYPFPEEKQAYLLTTYSPVGEIWGAFSFFPYKAGRGMVLDSMMRKRGVSSGMVETALVRSVEFFKGLGIEEVSLGIAPLSNVKNGESADNFWEKGISLIADLFNHFYHYRSLFTFKEKFVPVWRHRYLAYPSNVVLPQAGIALVEVHIKEGWLGLIKRKLSGNA